MGAGGPAHPLTRMRIIASTAIALHDFPKPTIAKVPGPAMGGGWNLALCCDFVICSTNATFAQIFPRRGLSVDVGGSWLLPRLIGMQKAKLLTMTGDVLTATQAEKMGLVTQVVEPGELDSVVAGFAARLASGPPIALSLTKALLHGRPGQTSRAASRLKRGPGRELAGEDTDRPDIWPSRPRRRRSFTGLWRSE